MKVHFEAELPDELAVKYMDCLVGRFYKILPMWENKDGTVTLYIISLLNELCGSVWLSEALENDHEYLSLISVLRWMLDNGAKSSEDVRREVFHCISICKRIRNRMNQDGAEA